MAKKKKNKWFDFSAFNDGYDVGDITKTVVRSAKKTSKQVKKATNSLADETLEFITSGVKKADKSDFLEDLFKDTLSRTGRTILGGMAGNSIAGDFLSRKAEDTLGSTIDGILGGNEKEDKRSYFSKGAFSDGYDVGDVTKTILGTAGDLGVSALRGSAEAGTGLAKLGAGGIGRIADAIGQDEYADKVRKNIEKSGDMATVGKVFDAMSTRLDKYSLFGEKTDDIASSVGSMGAAVGVQTFTGIPAIGVLGSSAAGSELGRAYESGATEGEAWTSAAITGASEAVFEKIGGIKFGGKALDTGLKKKISSSIANKTARNLTKLGLDAGTEGFEEVLTEIASNVGRKLTYEDEKTWKETLASEEALDSYVEAFIGGAVVGGGFNVGKTVNSIKTGRDYDTGLTDHEQAVVNAEVESRTSEKQKKSAVDSEVNKIIEERQKTIGELTETEKKSIREKVHSRLDAGELDYTTATLSKKERVEIENQVREDLENGYIGIDSIEGTLAKEKTTRIKELEQQLEGVNPAKKAEIEAEINQLKLDRATQMKGMLSKDNYLQESYRQELLKGQEFAREVTDKDSDITKELIESAKNSKMNNTRKMHDLFEYTNKIANDSKTKYGFVNNEQLKELGYDVEGVNINGLVRVDKGGSTKVLINTDSDKAINTIIGHETTHLLEETNEYAALQNIVKEYATTKGDYDGRLKQLTKLYEGTNANIENEVTADLVGDYLFTDEQFIHNLSAKEPNVFQKVYDYIKHAYKMATAGSKEARQLEQVKRSFDKAYKEISKATTQETKTNSLTEADSNTEYSLTKYTERQLDNWKSSKSIVVYESKEQLNEFINDAKAGELGNKKMYFGVVPEALADRVMEETGVDIRNRNVTLGAYEVQKIFKDHGDEVKEALRGQRAVTEADFESIVDVIESPDNIELSPDTYNGRPVLHFSKTIGDKVTVVSYDSIKHYDLRVQTIYVNKKRSLAPVTDEQAPVNTSETTSGTASTDNIPTKEDIVNNEKQSRRLTKEQEEYFKDSKVRDEDGNLKVMYHGTSAGGHTVFDPYGKAKYGLFGVGSYFTDNKSVAESYTEKGKGNNKQIYETYLNITNPIDMDAAADPAAWSKALPDVNFPAEGTNESFYRAMEEYFEDQEYSRWEASEAALEVMESMGYDGITHIGGGRFNKQDETRHQVYIAFQPEQVKNIDNAAPTSDPDIRFSFSGESALNADNQMLRKAKDMYNDFEDSETIRRETGWHRGQDGKWRFEIDDSQMKVYKAGDALYRKNNPGYVRLQELYDKFWTADLTSEEQEELVKLENIYGNEYGRLHERLERGNARLEDILEHDVLFENYPALRRIKVRIEALEGGTRGIFRPSRAEIVLDKELFKSEYRTEQRDKTLIHEIQHAIQEKEGFAGGASPEYYQSKIDELAENIRGAQHNLDLWLNDIGLNDFVIKSIKEMQKGKSIEQHWEDIQEFKRNSKYAAQIEASEKELKQYRDMYDEFTKGMTAGEMYHYTAGEIEARDTANRLKLDAEQRRNTRPDIDSPSIFVEGNKVSLSTEDSDIAPIRDDYKALTERDIPHVEQQGTEALRNITDDMAPVEMDELMYDEDELAAVPENPLEADGRDIEEVGDRKIKAYMYENPEVKPFFQEEAAHMLTDLQNSVKGQKHFNDQVYYDSNGEQGWYGTKRQTSEEIAYLLDNFNYKYSDIEKGLKAIIEDHGAENNAVSKRIEFMLDERLREGYTDMMYGDAMPPNEEYLNLLRDKQITEYSDEAYEAWVRSLADVEAPVEPITQGGIDYIRNLSREAGIDTADITGRYGVGSLEEMSREQYMDAVKWLDQEAIAPVRIPEAPIEDIAPVEPPQNSGVQQEYDFESETIVENEKDIELVRLEKKKKDELKKLGKLPAYTSRRASELYEEVKSMRKGIRVSQDLGYILDNMFKGVQKTDDNYYEIKDFTYRELTDALLNIESNPSNVVDKNSHTEALIRKSIEQRYNWTVDEINSMKLDSRAQARRKIRNALIGENGSLIEVLSKAKDKPAALLSNTDTIRLNEIVFGREAGRKINEAVFQKAIDNEARSIYWQNKERDDIRALGIKPKSKMSAAVQKYGEKQYVNEYGDVVPYDDVELKKEFPNKEDREKIIKAANIIRQKYDLYLDRVNKAFTELGFDPIPKRKDYMRHFQEFNDVFSRMGVPFNPKSMEEYILPTDVNGLTEFRRPQKNWFANALKRTGMRTEYDAITGIDGYIGSAANLIFHTEDIQRGRALGDLIRETWGESKGKENLEKDTMLSDEERLERLDQIGNKHLSKYVVWLDKWTNTIAGKKTTLDRAPESEFGRGSFAALDTIRKQVGANMIGFNLSSAMTNLIAPVQAMAKTNKVAMLKGGAETVRNIFHKDDFVDKNSFLTSRFGTDKLSKTLWEKAMDAGYVFMKGVDHFSSNLIVRSKYNELISKGMSEQEAHKEAGKFAARIMGDRTKGAQPSLYDSKLFNATLGQFQLEVNNQLYSMFYDTYHDSKEKAEGKAAKATAGMLFTFGQLAAFTHIFGKGFEALAGYNPTFDIIGIIMTALGLGDEDEEKTAGERLQDAQSQLIKALPYINVITGGGRIPIADALPIKEIVHGVDEYGNKLDFGGKVDAAVDAARYFLLPTGGNQIKKTKGGLKMFSDNLPVAGSYTDSGNLRFPVEETPANIAQAAIFGQWANKNARDYFDNERQPLKEKQIQEYKELDIPIADYWKYREGLADQDTLEEKFDYIADLDLPVSKKNIMINNIVDREEAVDMINYDDFGSYEEFDFATKHPEEYAIAQAIGYDTYKLYSSAFNDIYADKDINGKSISGSRKIKIIEYLNSTDMTYEEKIIMFKHEYAADDTYNMDIINYLNSRDDISYEQMEAILIELGFTVDANGNIFW